MKKKDSRKEMIYLIFVYLLEKKERISVRVSPLKYGPCYQKLNAILLLLSFFLFANLNF